MFGFKYKRPPGLTHQQWQKLAAQALPTLEKVTPVCTGNLKQSTEQKMITQRSVSVGYNTKKAPYAQYVQSGNTRGAPAQDMFGKTTQILNSKARKMK